MVRKKKFEDITTAQLRRKIPLTRNNGGFNTKKMRLSALQELIERQRASRKKRK